MSRTCEVTGKKRQSGMQVSHAMNHTRKWFEVNIQKKRFWVPSQKRWVTLRVTGAGMRTIAKIGIEAALQRANELKIQKA